MTNPLTNQMRQVLLPIGSNDLVKLRLHNYSFVNLSLITEAVDELEKLIPLQQVGLHEFNSLEKLAILLLAESADIGIEGA